MLKVKKKVTSNFKKAGMPRQSCENKELFNILQKPKLKPAEAQSGLIKREREEDDSKYGQEVHW